MTVTRYNIALNTFGDIINALRDVFLRKQSGSSSAGMVPKDDELAFLINKCYVLLENYQWSWAKKRANSTATGRITTTSGTSAYTLPVLARDKKPLVSIYDSTNPPLTEILTIEEYQERIRGRSGTGTPKRFCYIEKYDTARAYTTGTVSGTSGEYTLTGSGTSWLMNLFCGSTITPLAGSALTAAKVVSDTEVILTAALTSTIAVGTTYSASTTYPLIQIDFDPIPSTGLVYDFVYCSKFVPLIANTCIPLLPLNDRWVLVDGAYSLYRWIHDEMNKSGISPHARVIDQEAFLLAPSAQQKFYNQYVAKLLADDKALVGPAKLRMRFKRGY